MPAAPLTGVRILDLTRVMSGPFATMSLGDLGAEVIKIEDPKSGDDSRQFSPFTGDGTSTYFLAVNRNKKSVAIDIKANEGRAAVLAIAEKVDVVIENFRTGVAERRGLAYEQIKAVNPAVIYCSISGYGRDGQNMRTGPGTIRWCRRKAA